MKPMKTLLLGILLVVSCSAPQGGDDVLSNGYNHLPKNNPFEGKWTWVQSHGDGIAGPYVADPVRAGYSWQLIFTESQGNGGRLITYKNGLEEYRYNYTYTESKNPPERRLLLTDDANDNYLWETKASGQLTHLYLRNVDACCDNTFEHHFVLIRD